MFRILFFAAATAVLYLSLSTPGNSAPPFPHFDKVGHFGAFAVLGALLSKAFPSMKLIRVVALLALFGALIELLQHFTSYRTASVADFIADIAGAAVGSAIIKKIFNR